jgi:hypothetical protein
MNRELDGIYLRVKRDGKYQAICLSDMTKEELEENLDAGRGEWLKGAVIHLALTLHAIGDQFGIASADAEEEGAQE